MFTNKFMVAGWIECVASVYIHMSFFGACGWIGKVCESCGRIASMWAVVNGALMAGSVAAEILWLQLAFSRYSGLGAVTQQSNRRRTQGAIPWPAKCIRRSIKELCVSLYLTYKRWIMKTGSRFLLWHC